jgi:hypothetical protein
MRTSPYNIKPLEHINISLALHLKSADTRRARWWCFGRLSLFIFLSKGGAVCTVLVQQNAFTQPVLSKPLAACTKCMHSVDTDCSAVSKCMLNRPRGVDFLPVFGEIHCMGTAVHILWEYNAEGFLHVAIHFFHIDRRVGRHQSLHFRCQYCT